MADAPAVKSKMKRSLSLSRRYWWLLAVWLCALAFLLFQGGKLAFMLLAMATVLCVYLLSGRFSGIASMNGERTVAEYRSGAVLKAGTALRVGLDMRMNGFWPIPYLLVKERLIRRGGGNYGFEMSVIPDWKKRCRTEYVTKPLYRGFYYFADTTCSTEDVFGLFEHQGHLSMGYSFSVLPQIVQIGSWRYFNSLYKGQYMQSVTTRAFRETTQINGVRDYLYGDRISRIHWNATARTGTWKSKEYEKESLPKMFMFLDGNQYAYGKEEQFELAVSTAASLLSFAEREELAVGLITAGKKPGYFDARRSAGHFTQIFNHLIGVEANGVRPLTDYLHDQLRMAVKGSLFVVISPQQGEKMEPVLKWGLGRQMHVCQFCIGGTRTLKGEDGNSWRDKMRRNGIELFEIAALQELPAVLEARV